ncbi:glycosyltransferase [Nocardioides sp. T2.26MG-1]|uniref:glycosyltransferase n=1 Tax=Nocardioides sp. T2.26MG-1 TaxID=3041166 RepID=UPI002477B16B|nr:glycosyltransferase [Nocardioides sp. T2.26MG-1]CAI9398730.1 hypothetical protein HIDPHFAB_00054 [Nocardioides sp. T2.26MG-1]
MSNNPTNGASRTGEPPVASVVIPAHDEAEVIASNLSALVDGVEPGSLEVIVVCNGCTDDTAAVARSVPGVHVVEIPEPSKARAVEVGNRATKVFPRVHLDADVRISGADVLRLVAPLIERRVLATAPARQVPLDGCSWIVRAYLEVWDHLPQVRSGLFGRGVVALSEEGQARVDAVSGVMNDDLAVSDAFVDSERLVVAEATVLVWPPRTVESLLNRRVRVATGNVQADRAGVRRRSSATRPATLLRLSLRHPRVAIRLPVFLGVSALARRRAERAVRAGDFSTWLRDESSRVGMHPTQRDLDRAAH